MKAHIGVDADSGLVHTVIGTAANDATQAAGLLHDQKSDARADAGHRGVDKREKPRTRRCGCMWPCNRARGERSTPDASCTGCWNRRGGSRPACGPRSIIRSVSSSSSPATPRSATGVWPRTRRSRPCCSRWETFGDAPITHRGSGMTAPAMRPSAIETLEKAC